MTSILFQPGDLVFLPDKIPGTNRPLPPGTVGIVIEVPEEYEGRFVVVRIPGDRYERWTDAAGTGWTFYADTLHHAPVASS